MMITAIARAELSYLRRSRLALISSALFAACLIFATLSSHLFLAQETAHRLTHQAEANQVFESQPDRHPHRMVHYGQYVFRAPPPLAAIDPGLDAYGGTAIFLEGHRQNAAMFAQAAEGATLTRFGTFTPAFVLQVFAPLFLILLGYACITREREAGTLRAILAQGTSMRALVSGKTAVLLGAAGLCLVPLALVALVSVVFGGASAFSAAALLVCYGLYLSLWAVGSVCISVLVKRGSTALLVLASLWLATVVVLPKLAADTAAQMAPLKSAFERSIEMKTALRALGDSHNTKDPAFTAFQRRILAQYNVDSIDALPVNIGGLLAFEGERQSAEVIARFNAEDQAARAAQQTWISAASLLSPMIAAHSASQALSATDLASYHRFLQEAEAHRVAFVQELNMVHATEVDIKDDKRRRVDPNADRAARVSSQAWAALPRFEFTPAPADTRIASAAPYLIGLMAWLAIVAAMFFWLTRRPQL